MSGHTSDRISNSNCSGLNVHGRLLAVFAVLGAALGAVDAGTAQEAAGLSIEVSECIELESPAERLACFESRIDRALEDAGDANGATATAPATEVEPAAAARGSDQASPAARSSSDDFGFAPQDEGEAGREELFATITSVREIEPNRYTITLDNGQVWRQVLRDRYRLRPGLQVRIYPTRWGESYRLSVGESRGFVQVQRVR